jgi:predicted secreted hydrolase
MTTGKSARILAQFILIFFACLSVCYGQAGKATAAMETSPDAYKKLGLSGPTIKPWEDGMRTTGGRGSYEWWYFDGSLDDGSSLVIVFYTKDMIMPNKPLKPKISIELDRPDGTKVHNEVEMDSSYFSASKDSCNVRIGANSFSGNLHDYAIHVDIDGIKADIALHGTVPSWRPNTGFMNFQKGKDSHYFAWLPSVPQGNVNGTVTISGRAQAIKGVGYHDHNWGDVSMLKLIHDWYWGRAQVGNYSVIASYITAADKYNNAVMPIFMLARDGKIVADDFTKVKFSTSNIYTDEYTKKPVANMLVYDYIDGVTHYRVTFNRSKDLVRQRFADRVKGLKAILVKLVGFDGAYMRFTGEVTIERFEGDKKIETVKEKSAVWELMYFGHAPHK